MFTALLIVGFHSIFFLSEDLGIPFTNSSYPNQHHLLSDPDSTLFYALQAYQLAKSSDKQRVLGHAAFELGRIYYNQEQYDRAMEHFEESRAIAEQIQDVALISRSLDKKASIYLKTGDPPLALPLQQSALQHARNAQQPELLISLLRNLGYTYWLLQEYDSALHYYQQRIPLCSQQEDIQRLIEAHIDVARGFYLTRKFEACIPHYEEALRLGMQIENKTFLPNISVYLAYAYTHIGAHQKAYYTLLTSLPYLKRAQTKRELAAVYLTLGTISLQLVNIEESIQFFQQSAEICLSIKDEQRLANSLNNLGLAYYHSKNYYQSRKHLFKSQKLCIKNGYAELQAYTHDNLGKVYLALQQADSALYHYHKALQIRRQIAHPPHPNLADVHTELAKAYLFLREDVQVEHHFRESIHALGIVENDQNKSLYAVPPGNDPVSGEEYLDLMRLKGDYLGTAFTDTIAWEAGLQHYEKGIHFLLNSYVFAQDLEQSKLAWLTLYRPMFESGIELAQRLYDTTHQMAYLERGFALVEQNKALLLRQSLQETQAKASANIPDSLMTSEQVLRQALSLKETELLKAEQAKDSAKVWKIRTDLAQVRQQYFQWTKDIETTYPDYYALKYKATPVSVREIQQQLASRTGLANYFLGEKYLFSFSITRDTLLSHQYVLPDDWNTRLQTFYHALTNHDDLYSDREAAVRQTIAEQGYYFYQTLVASLLETTHQNIDKLIVVPDGALNLLPFSVLLTEQPQQLDYSTFPYLLKKLSVQYAYSANLYFQPLAPALPLVKRYAFGGFTADYSIKDSGDSMEYSLVPKARQLAKEAAGMMGGKVWENATKEIFLTHAPQCRMIHFGGHAIAGNAALSDNRLVLHANPPNDRYLYLPEIYNLNLQGTELVVLSGCDTGTGVIKSGEGVISMARSFQYAGAQNVLLTLNVIPDASTRQLLQSFYTYLDSGFTIDASLQQAKLQYISKNKDDRLLSHPLYWANIVTFGRGGEMKLDFQQDEISIFPIAIVLIVLISGGFLLWVFREKAPAKKVLHLFLR